MKIEWSVLAIEDRDRIYSFIEQDDPLAAINIDERIADQIERLGAFPKSGRPGRVSSTRELVIDRTPFIIAYTTAAGTVKILRILYGAQQWPDQL